MDGILIWGATKMRVIKNGQRFKKGLYGQLEAQEEIYYGESCVDIGDL